MSRSPAAIGCKANTPLPCTGEPRVVMHRRCIESYVCSPCALFIPRAAKHNFAIVRVQLETSQALKGRVRVQGAKTDSLLELPCPADMR